MNPSAAGAYRKIRWAAQRDVREGRPMDLKWATSTTPLAQAYRTAYQKAARQK